MSKTLLDTSVFIPLLRTGEHLEKILPLTQGDIFYLSSVVAQELYIGSRDKQFTWQMDKLYYRFEKIGRLIVPTSVDWRLAGLALSRLGNHYGFDKIRRASLINDALIAASCRRAGVLLLTFNAKDFCLLQEVIDFEYRVPKK